MKRAVAKALLQVGGKCSSAAAWLRKEAVSTRAAASLVPEGTRCLSSSHPETPLSKILPPIVALPRQIIGTALSLTGKLVSSAASSGAAKSVVTSFAEEVLLKEQFLKLSELDVAYWTYWLASTGYTSQVARRAAQLDHKHHHQEQQQQQQKYTAFACQRRHNVAKQSSKKGGYKKLAEAAKAALPGLEAQQVASLVEGMHMAKYSDKALLDEVARHISANFTKYETEDLLKILSALHDFGYYSRDLYDDIGDSIAYANHYLAPLKAPTDQVAKALATYAKFGHERADVMVTLARGISELGLSKLSQAARGEAVATALQALHTFHFYPEQVDALLYFTSEESELFSGEQLKLADAVRAAVEAQTGGKLAVYKTNDDEDAAHWYGHHTATAPAHHELFVLRESLVPKAYSPAALRPK
ncbi:hypothetical protein QJQ45_029801 [Haematococcus lacustris]|nr:hypothetical protein QJQ45_029801 [Haematococcus lacustris]